MSTSRALAPAKAAPAVEARRKTMRDVSAEPLQHPVVVNLSTGIDENPERMMLALFTAESALAHDKRVLMFLSLEAIRAMLPGAMAGVIPCDGCPSLEKLFKQVVRAGVEIYVCPMCLKARKIDPETLVAPAVPAGTAKMMEWMGDQDASVFSF